MTLTIKEVFQALVDGKTIVEVVDNAVDGHVPLELKLFCTDILKVVNCTNQNRKNTPAMEYDISKLITYKWKIKPEVILINGIEVPKPESVAPIVTTEYFFPVLDCTGGEAPYESSHYDIDEYHTERLNLGLVHLTEEAAIKHAKALLSFTRNTNV